MALFEPTDLQRLCRIVIHSNDVSIQSLPNILQKDFQYECCCSNNLFSAYQNDHLECAKASNPSKRAVKESCILRLSLTDGNVKWLKWSRENGALWTHSAICKYDENLDPECLQYARENGCGDCGDENYSDDDSSCVDSSDDDSSCVDSSDIVPSDDDSSDDDSSDDSSSPSYCRGFYRRKEEESEESEESEDSDEDSLSWFTESDDDESDAVLDTDEEWSDDDEDDVNKLINVVRSKLPQREEIKLVRQSEERISEIRKEINQNDIVLHSRLPEREKTKLTRQSKERMREIKKEFVQMKISCVSKRKVLYEEKDSLVTLVNFTTTTPGYLKGIVEEKQIKHELTILKDLVKYFDTKEALINYIKTIMKI